MVVGEAETMEAAAAAAAQAALGALQHISDPFTRCCDFEIFAELLRSLQSPQRRRWRRRLIWRRSHDNHRWSG